MLIELIVAMAVIGIAAGSSVAAMLAVNRQANAYRMLTAARGVVERNIERALAVSYDSLYTPDILSLTGAEGVTYDDDGGGDNLVNIYSEEIDGSRATIKGTLTRIVAMESNPQLAPIKRVTFRVKYNFRGRDYVSVMTTLRSIDDF